MQVARAQGSGQIGLRETVKIAVEHLKQRVVARAGNRDADVLCLSGDEGGDERAGGVVNVILHHGAVAGGNVGLFALDSLKALLGGVVNNGIFKAVRVDQGS